MRTMSVLVLCLLFTAIVRAQGTAPATPVGASAPLPHTGTLVFAAESPRLDAPLRVEDPLLANQNWKPFDLPTIGVQTLCGGIGAGIFVAVGAGAMSGSGLDGLAAGIMVAYLGGSMVGVPLGVLYGGDMMGGEASTGAVFAGSAIGTATGILAFFVTEDAHIGNAVYITAALAGPILGYHLSATSSEERARRGGLNGLALRQPAGADRSSDAFAPQPGLDPLTPTPDIRLPLLALRF